MLRRNRILLFLCIFVFSFFINVRGVNAYEFTENSYFIKLVDKTAGEITIYIPADKVQFLSLQEDDHVLVNVSSGSFYGYFIDGGTEYRVTFPSFDVPTYRATSNNYNTVDLDISDIIETNINFVDDSMMFILNDSYLKFINVITVSFGVVILCLMFLKR